MDDAAEASTGALILFIAVLVAAAWGVVTIMKSVVDLQGKSSETAHESSADVSTGLRILAAFGVRNASDQDVWDLHVLTELAPGSATLDLTHASMTFEDGSTARRYAHDAAPLANGSAPSPTFNATWILGNGGSTFAMAAGDRVDLHVNLMSTELAPRTDFTLLVAPEKGTHPRIRTTTPSTYGPSTIVPLAWV